METTCQTSVPDVASKAVNTLLQGVDSCKMVVQMLPEIADCFDSLDLGAQLEYAKHFSTFAALLVSKINTTK